MAKQTISHGAQIDAATPAEIAALIAEAFSQQGTIEYRRIKGTIQLSAAGSGNSVAADIVVPSNYDMLLERITIGGSGAANANVLIYENDFTSDTNLLEAIVVGAGGRYSDGFSNNIYVTANSVILIAVGNATPNLQVTYNLQGRLRAH